jgi:hypothetical protein
MRLRAFCAAAVLGLIIPQGCSLLPDDGSGTNGADECTGGPINVSIPATVFCDITRIAATVSGPDMTTQVVTIDRNNPSVTLTIPSGPERHLVVNVFTADNPGSPSFTSGTFTFCVPDGQPVSVSVDVAETNRNPIVGAISLTTTLPGPGPLRPGNPVSLSVSAEDPDACDGVTGFTWSTAFGIITGSGNTAVWRPRCPTFAACDATVEVTVEDGRGGTTAVQATYQVDRLR